MHQRKTLSKRQQASATLRPRYYNAQDDPLSIHATKRPPVVPKTQQHLPIPIVNADNQNQIVPPRDVSDDGNKREIDGFYLLEVSGISFPEDLQHIILSDRKLKSVVDEDLTYFAELLFVDVSENLLPLFPFGALPKLRELRIACNRIKTIEELFGFNELMYLDLSYNQLHFQCIEHLYELPMLKELDLSGNALRQLPTDLFRFESLEKLILQYNKFDDNSLFRSFGTIPVLRNLDVSNNYFSSFPADAMEDSFKYLDTMDISFNFFGNEDDIHGMIYLQRLETLLLYGNPMLGPTGEDPMFIYIEDVVDQANDHRDSIKSTISYIDFVTEIPKKRILKKGEPLGRLALYRDFSIVQVDSRISSKSNREWRKKGIQTIFGEMMAGRRVASTANLAPLVSAAHANVPDYTFITNSIVTSNNFTAYQKFAQQQPQPTSTTGSNNPNASNMGLKESDRNAIADAVMRKVVNEMDLTGEEDLQLFESYAKLPPTVVEEELRRAIAGSGDGEFGGISISTGSSPNQNGAEDAPQSPLFYGGGADHSLLLQPLSPSHASLPRDHLPEHLFQSSNLVQTTQLPPSLSLAAQPIALKTAMKALQRALDQPLTSYDAVPNRWSVNEHDYGRHTLTSKLRQQPRILLVDGADGQPQHQNPQNQSNAFKGNYTGGLETSQSRRGGGRVPTAASSTLQSAGQRGLAEPIALKKYREDARDRTLQQIDTVLASLNASTRQLTAFERPDFISTTDAIRHSNNGDELLVEGHSKERDAQDYNRQHREEVQGMLYVKQSIENMRDFSRPHTGVKPVVRMMTDILDEFQS